MTPSEASLVAMIANLSDRLFRLHEENVELRKRPTAEYAASSDALIKELQEQNRKLLERPTWERVQYLEKQLAQAQKTRRRKR